LHDSRARTEIPPARCKQVRLRVFPSVMMLEYMPVIFLLARTPRFRCENTGVLPARLRASAESAAIQSSPHHDQKPRTVLQSAGLFRLHRLWKFLDPMRYLGLQKIERHRSRVQHDSVEGKQIKLWPEGDLGCSAHFPNGDFPNLIGTRLPRPCLVPCMRRCQAWRTRAVNECDKD
jgi:hypothetical protein